MNRNHRTKWHHRCISILFYILFKKKKLLTNIFIDLILLGLDGLYRYLDSLFKQQFANQAKISSSIAEVKADLAVVKAELASYGEKNHAERIRIDPRIFPMKHPEEIDALDVQLQDETYFKAMVNIYFHCNAFWKWNVACIYWAVEYLQFWPILVGQHWQVIGFM